MSLQAAPAGELWRSGATRGRRCSCEAVLVLTATAVLSWVSSRGVRRWERQRAQPTGPRSLFLNRRVSRTLMTDAERVQLLHGPYTPPRLKRGDRTFCLYKDCDVIVTPW